MQLRANFGAGGGEAHLEIAPEATLADVKAALGLTSSQDRVFFYAPARKLLAAGASLAQQGVLDGGMLSVYKGAEPTKRGQLRTASRKLRASARIELAVMEEGAAGRARTEEIGEAIMSQVSVVLEAVQDVEAKVARSSRGLLMVVFWRWRWAAGGSGFPSGGRSVEAGGGAHAIRARQECSRGGRRLSWGCRCFLVGHRRAGGLRWCCCAGLRVTCRLRGGLRRPPEAVDMLVWALQRGPAGQPQEAPPVLGQA
jgi:hypothetical protein